MHERALKLFWQRIAVLLDLTPGDSSQQHNRAITAFYRRQRAAYLVILVTGSLAAVGALHAAINSGFMTSWLGLFDVKQVQLFFALSLAAYGFLGWGLFNGMFCLTLVRPDLALKPVLLGIAVLLAAGIPLSLGVHFMFAAVAFLLSAIAFGWYAQRTANKVLDAADYFYVSSL
jgi:hypothetical protein